jgi:hypothetical protein
LYFLEPVSTPCAAGNEADLSVAIHARYGGGIAEADLAGFLGEIRISGL